jgi:hypothetical protein
MTKAYDIAVLAEKLKGRGLDVAEEAVKVLVEEMFVWVEESAKLSATPYDDMAMIILPQMKAMAVKAVDKIDGQIG